MDGAAGEGMFEDREAGGECARAGHRRVDCVDGVKHQKVLHCGVGRVENLVVKK